MLKKKIFLAQPYRRAYTVDGFIRLRGESFYTIDGCIRLRGESFYRI